VLSDAYYLAATATIVSAASGTTTFSVGGFTSSTLGAVISATPVITQGPSSWAVSASFNAITAGHTITFAINEVCSIATNSQSPAYLTSCSFNQFSVGGSGLPAGLSAELAAATSILNSELATTTQPLATVTAAPATTKGASAAVSTQQSIPVVGILSVVMGAFALGCLVL
jgi:hypothetical protein